MQRMTEQRRVLLEELSRLSSHPTAKELCEIVRLRLPRVSLATVYRNLELLAADGHIQKLEYGGSESRFDARVDDHAHARCLRCGKVCDVELSTGINDYSCAVSDSAFQVTGAKLEFVGFCTDCNDHAGSADHSPSS